jgi:hypothetical protein
MATVKLGLRLLNIFVHRNFNKRGSFFFYQIIFIMTGRIIRVIRTNKKI